MVLLFSMFLAVFVVSSRLVSADTTTQSNVNEQINTFQSQLNSELTQVNKLYQKVNESQTQVQEAQSKIDTLESQIAQAEKDEVNLTNSIANQMRSLQSNGGVMISVIDIITSSNNLTAMIQRLANLNIVMSAESAQVQDLKNTQNSLKKMKIQLEETKKKLVQNEQSYKSEVSNLQGNISNLQSKISSNQKLLSDMKAQAAAEQKARDAKIAADAAASAKAAKEKAAQSSSSSSSSSSSNQSSNSNQSNSTGNSGNSGSSNNNNGHNNGGKTMTALATAYSWQNVGYITAMGIDLRTNPMCIAVDPSVIPLGSLIEVPGYGIAIAGDTGGAIKGNHIDVHFPTVAQAVAWGAKTVQITILK